MSLDDSDYKKKVQQSEELAEKFSFNLSKAWDTAKAGAAMAAGAVTAVTGALVGISAATEEYRVAQGKLNAAFEAAGYSSETATTAYSEFYKILGDTDTATEASQLLAQLAENEQDMETWTRTAAGVWGTFGDSLPIESLIEASNETAKTGVVVGTLADALNWVGISEDEFNEKLAAAGSEAERNRLIMDTLSATYDDAADAFYRNNEQIIHNRENQQRLTEIMAQVGDAVDRVKSALLEEFAPAISAAGEALTDWLNGIDVGEIIDTAVEKITAIKDAFVLWLPAITGIISAITMFRTIMTISALIDTATKAMTAFKTAQNASTVAQAALNAVMNLNPFVLVATLIAGVVTALLTLWATNEDFRNAVIDIWGAIQDKFKEAWEFIKSVWDAAEPYFAALWEGIKATFSVVSAVLGRFFSDAWSVIKIVWNAASGYFQNIFNTIKGIFSAVTALFRGDFEGAWNAIKNVLSGWYSYFQGLFNQIREIFGRVWDVFWDIGRDAIDALKNGISSAWNSLVSWFNGIWDSLFGNRTANVTVNTTENRTVRTINGSHANGLSYVPFDGYIAELHKGERVLTAREASAYNAGGPVNITVNAAPGQSARQIAQEVAVVLERQRERRAAGLA